ncbi:universal stress protein [Nocardioides sp.]|uniref:universal stress protein n=1 Tax=Nocardioides sp. TaxID=35761 RepID=UPI003D100AA3
MGATATNGTERTADIVVGVDGSEQSTRALVWALKLARAHDWRVEAVTAWPDAEAVFVRDVPGHSCEPRQRALDLQDAALGRATRALGRLPALDARIVNARPLEALRDRASSARLVVVGSHGPTAPLARGGRAPLGECLRAVVDCPVILIDGQQGEPSSGAGGTGGGSVPRRVAWSAVARSVPTVLAMVARGRLSRPRHHVGCVVRFADATAARVYRETVVRGRTAADPCVLAVCFRLRHVHGPAHAFFRAESLLNTPLFAGFPGFVSKLWFADDDHEVYRGLYAWDGAGPALHYARSLSRVLALVSEPGSVDFRVVPRLSLDRVLDDPTCLEPRASPGGREWWRVLSVAPPAAQS